MKEQEKKEKMHFSDAALLPREELLETGRKRKHISIGIPRDTETTELRVALTPEAVNILVESGNEVYIQEGSGK